MIKNKTNSAVVLTLFILGSAASWQVRANSSLADMIPLFKGKTLLADTSTAPILIKRGEKYDESKDPALRKGTENEEMPQSSFFAIPAIVLGIAGLVWFLTREKK